MPIRIPRSYIHGEVRYAIEAAGRFFPGFSYRTEFTLGVPPLLKHYPPEMKEIIEQFRGSYAICDIGIWKGKELYLMEAKLRPAKFLDAFGKLMVYRDLIPVSPYIKEKGFENIYFVLLTPVENPYVTKLCREQGFQNIVWTPPWYDKVLKKYAPTYKEVPEREKTLGKLLKGKLKPPHKPD